MKTSLGRRFAATIAMASLLASLVLAVGPGVALAATDPGCTALGGSDGAGTCFVGPGVVPVSGTITVNENLVLQNGAHLDATGTQPGGFTLVVNGFLTMETGSILEGDDDGLSDSPLANAGGSNLTIDVSGDLLMEVGSRISSDNNQNSGSGGNITISAANVTLKGTTPGTDNCGYPLPNPALGAVISSRADDSGELGGTITIAAGNYPNIPPVGTLITERCSRIDVGGNGSAGEIILTAGHSMDIDGLVLSESTLTGVGAGQPRGGGPITAKAGCDLLVSDSGVVSSKGRDPGADLVLIKACDVVIDGVVQSTAPGDGHVLPENPPNRCNGDPAAHPPGVAEGFTGCVRIIGQDVTIDATGAHNGNVNVDGIRNPMKGWIDIFATEDITILGEPAGASTKWAVSADACPAGAGGSPPCSNSFGGVITIKAVGGKVTTRGQAIVQADATAIGSDGGRVIIEAGGPVAGGAGDVDLDGSYIKATGPSGSNTRGGTISIRSYNGTITSGGDTTGLIDARGDSASASASSNPGQVTTDECDPGSPGAPGNYLGAIPTTPAGPPISTGYANVTRNFGICGGTPTLPADAQELIRTNQPIWTACEFQSPLKSGFKFNDLDGDGVYEPLDGESGIADWPIDLLLASDNSVVQSTTTLGNGTYSFVIAAPGTYRVCEGTGPAGYVQTFPTLLTTPPLDESITGACPGPNTIGYEFTVGGSENLRGNDFGNRIPPVTCKEDPNRAALLTRTVNPNKPLGGGGIAGNPKNYWLVQAAYDDAKASAQTEVIGMYGTTRENLLLDGARNLVITQCESAKVYALDNSKPVWKITATGKLTIIGPDAYGGSYGWDIESPGQTLKAVRAYGTGAANTIGVLINSSSNSVSFNSVSGYTTGVKILGTGNDVRSGTIKGNTTGVEVGGSANKLSGSTVGPNTGVGVLVSGAGNTIQGVSATLNGAGGFKATGANNLFDSNKAFKNTGIGIETTATATGTKFKNNASNTGNAGSSNENTGAEYKFGALATNQGGNKKDNLAFTSTAVNTYE